MPLPYRDYDEIKKEISNFFLNELGITVQPGTISRALMDIMADLSSTVYEDINDIGNVYSLYKANGKDLDSIGQLFNLERRMRTVAHDFGQNVKIAIDSSYGARTASDLINLFNADLPLDMHIFQIYVPAGTWLSDPSGDKSVLTTTDGTFEDTDREVYVSVRGSYGTGNLGPHSLTKVLPFDDTNIEKFLKADNIDTLTGAQSEESDDDFRYRIARAIRIAATASRDGIEDAAMSIPSISTVSVSNNRYGIGTFEVLINSTNAIVSVDELRAVSEAVDRNAAMGTYPVVTPPIYTGVYLKFLIKFDANFVDRNDYVPMAQLVVKNYINNLPMGDTLYLENITREIKSLTESILSVTYEKIGIGEYIPELGDEILNIKPIATGDLFANYNEKFVTGTSVLEPRC